MLMITDPEFGASNDPATKPLRDLIEKRLMTILSVLASWPSWALVLKSLHDIGQGWMLFLVVVGLDVAMTVLDILDNDDLSTLLLLLYLGLIVMLAAIRGMPGANRYGPDPLAPAVGPPER